VSVVVVVLMISWLRYLVMVISLGCPGEPGRVG